MRWPTRAGHARTMHAGIPATDGAGWTWDSLLPYFRRQEGNRRLHNESHGRDGPLAVSDPRYCVEAGRRFVETLERMGVPYRSDLNAGSLNGVTYMQTTIANGRRCSAGARLFASVEG